MIRSASAAVLLAALAASPAAASETRSSSAHEHGHGQLNIAIEGNSVLMELEIPGADIVGFEHEAKSDADKAAMTDAEKKLKDGAALFHFQGATCTFAQAQVEDGHEDHGKQPAAQEEQHSEFHVAYEISCDDASRLTGIEFPFFAVFPHSEELDVTVLGAQGQFKYEVERDTPMLPLKN
ncbi:DUF2796 domain-containing protein [Nisaea sediminum]|uniref:DUF2796 domain-containing protein n=1 Tax=Nisaea sediminum TaxID=2775867 RepID=UPI0018675994|nr:DUF2796 domain-containing protein [Nisaea sediminum]